MELQTKKISEEVLNNPSEEISVGEFVFLLMNCKNNSASKNLSLTELLRYGHFRLWLEDQDETHPENPLNRQTAARILHEFLRIECGLNDLQDITSATQLKDLYTCRVCTNHIAQVCARGLMHPQEIQTSVKEEQIFNHLELVQKNEVQEILKKVKALGSTCTPALPASLLALGTTCSPETNPFAHSVRDCSPAGFGFLRSKKLNGKKVRGLGIALFYNAKARPGTKA